MIAFVACMTRLSLFDIARRVRLSVLQYPLSRIMALLSGKGSQKTYRSGKGVRRNASEGDKQYSVTHNEFLPCRCLLMYPNKNEKNITKAPVEQSPLYEHMTGVDMLLAHKKLAENGSKAIEELHKVAVGISENAACLLGLLETLRAQATATVPLLNPALLPRLVSKISTYEAALSILDLSRDVPRSAEDIKDAVHQWFALGRELEKPHYQAFFASAQQVVPYLHVGIYRVRILSAIATNPKVMHIADYEKTVQLHHEWLSFIRNRHHARQVAFAAMTKHALPQKELTDWTSDPANNGRMEAMFVKLFQDRVDALMGKAIPEGTKASSSNDALAGLLAEHSDEEVQPPPKKSKKVSRKKCPWCGQMAELVFLEAYNDSYCTACAAL